MRHYTIILLLTILLVSLPAHANTYTTWAPWEIDSTVTAWYLKRNIAQNAKFKSVRKSTYIKPETSIDVPDSPYRRSAKLTAFDSAIRKHSIESFCTKKLVKMVRLLELAPWRKSTSAEAEAFERNIRPFLPKEPTVGGLEQAFDYIDKFCNKVNK